MPPTTTVSGPLPTRVTPRAFARRRFATTPPRKRAAGRGPKCAAIQGQSSNISSTDILPVLLEGTAAATGDDFFRSLARHAAQALGARYAFAARRSVSSSLALLLTGKAPGRHSRLWV